jgi:RND family efflux transporter MFP subunit
MKLLIPAAIKKRPIIITTSVVILIILALAFFRIGRGSPAASTYTVKPGEFVIDIKTNGELQAEKSVSVMVPGNAYYNLRVARLVDDGVFVEKGDFLLQFDTSEFEDNVKNRQNNLDNANAELASLKANIESTMQQLENSYITQQYTYEQEKLRLELMKFEAEAKKREKELDFKKAELSLQQAKEKIESQKVIDLANITKAELKVKQADMRLRQAQEQLASLSLTAPKSGMVVLQKIYSPNGLEKLKVGSTPWHGMELISIPDLTVMLVKTQVNEIDISRVQTGQQAVITVDALEGLTFYGKVTNVATLASTEEGSDDKVFDVEVTINGTHENLKPGMTALCTIIVDKIPGKLFVPLESVFEREDTTVVYVKKGGFSKRQVKVGAKNSDYIIIDQGVTAGEEVSLRDPTIPLEDLGLEKKKENGKQSNQKKA